MARAARPRSNRPGIIRRRSAAKPAAPRSAPWPRGARQAKRRRASSIWQSQERGFRGSPAPRSLAIGFVRSRLLPGKPCEDVFKLLQCKGFGSRVTFWEIGFVRPFFHEQREVVFVTGHRVDEVARATSPILVVLQKSRCRMENRAPSRCFLSRGSHCRLNRQGLPAPSPRRPTPKPALTESRARFTLPPTPREFMVALRGAHGSIGSTDGG